jgi:hypothetical protein
MRKHLKYDVALMWPKSFAPKSCQGECMRGVVGEVEAALERIRCIGRILEPREPERFRPSNSLVSGGSAASGLPVPLKRSSGEVMLAAYDPQFRLRDDAGRESVATLHALQPFGTAVDGRIDTTPQARIQRI